MRVHVRMYWFNILILLYKHNSCFQKVCITSQNGGSTSGVSIVGGVFGGFFGGAVLTSVIAVVIHVLIMRSTKKRISRKENKNDHI